MATVSIALSGSEYEPAAISGVKRSLDSYDSACELPPAVKLKNVDTQPALFLSAESGTKSLEDFSSPNIQVSTTEKLAPQPTRYGHRLIPQLIDDGAKHNPDASFWSIPRSSNLADGFRDINYAQVAGAINRAAWWIDENVGRSTTFEALAYMGPPDLRYAILTVAAQKTGHTVSHRSAKHVRELYLSLVGFLLFTLEHHGSALAPLRIRELPTVHHSSHSFIHSHAHTGQARNANFRDTGTR